ncbi:hypothetical protein ACWD3Z_19725 [Streptomyces sp. NPDC002740]
MEVGLRERWWRRIQWRAWGAVVAAIAAIGTLIFTGVATIYQARVSSSQLQQAQEDTALRLREQAAHVTFWVDHAGGQAQLHIKNGSSDPISEPLTAILLQDVGFILPLQGLAPCSEAVFNKSMLRYPNTGYAPVPPGTTLQAVALVFFDVDGRQWLRTLKKLEPYPKGLGSISTLLGEIKRPMGWAAKAPIIKASSCD